MTSGGLKVLRGLPRSHVTTSVGRVAQLPALSYSTRDFDEEDDEGNEDYGDSDSGEEEEEKSDNTGTRRRH